MFTASFIYIYYLILQAYTLNLIGIFAYFIIVFFC